MMISTKGRYALSTLIDIAEQEKKENRFPSRKWRSDREFP